MHKLISKEEAQVTRFLTLKNIETGTIDYCFDDSDIFGDSGENFYFMKEGNNYNCRIMLFGDTYPGPVGKKVLCRVVRENVPCGHGRHVEVMVGNDIYYVPQKEVVDQLKNRSFYYYYTRKDLIMVDGVIHGKYLLPIT